LKFTEIYRILYSFQKPTTSGSSEEHTEIQRIAITSHDKRKSDLPPLPTQKGMCKLIKFHGCSPTGQLLSMKFVSQANQIRIEKLNV
jgi:hypothetical protein